MSVKMNINGKLEQISGQLYHADIFPGQITMGANIMAPYGWLKCDGAAYLKTDYPELYAAIGDTYNKPGVEVGKFNVPDMTGRYVMGPDTGNGLGSKIAESVPNIKGETNFSKKEFDSLGIVRPDRTNGAFYTAESDLSERFPTMGTISDFPKGSVSVYFDASKTSSGNGAAYKDGAKVRPDTLVLNYFIKA